MVTQIVRIHFSGIGSTNTWAKTNVHLLDRDKITLVTADRQSAGRGRFQRKWISPSKENLYASFCFFVPKEQENLCNIPQILSLSAIKALEIHSFQPKIKWPNDILLNSKKLGGVLTETIDSDGKLLVVAGIGLNINMPLETAEMIDQPATSLFIEKQESFNSEEILTSLANHFSKDLEKFLKEGFTSFIEDYTTRLYHQPNQPMKLQKQGQEIEGSFHSINSDGSLNLQIPTGEVKRFITGELFG